MIRFIAIDKYEILADAEDAGKMLAKAVLRKIPMRFSGICDLNDTTLMVILEERPSEEKPPREYVFSPFETDPDFDDVSAAVRSRFDAGYDTLGSFRINGILWGLFSRPSGV